jgi:hypothetical protein
MFVHHTPPPLFNKIQFLSHLVGREDSKIPGFKGSSGNSFVGCKAVGSQGLKPLTTYTSRFMELLINKLPLPKLQGQKGEYLF